MSKLLKLFVFFNLTMMICYASAQDDPKVKKVATVNFPIFKSKKARDPQTHPSRSMKNKSLGQKAKISNKHVKTKTHKRAYIRHIHKSIPDFDKLLVDGNIIVELHSGYGKPRIVIKGDRRDLFALTAEVKKHTLVLYAGAGVPDYAPIKVIIKGRYIHDIKLKNNASIKGHALKLSYLDLDVKHHSTAHLGGYLMVHKVNIQDYGTVRLDGVRSKHLEVCIKENANLKINGKANLARLEASDHSKFSMAWVDSWNLIAKVTGDAYIQLAGIVNKLDASVYDNAHWNGRFLRSRQTFMKTYGHALARISAVNKQHTLALDKSNIYFYNLSTYRTDFMAYDGSVLDMRDWQIRAWFDYDHYNKDGGAA